MTPHPQTSDREIDATAPQIAAEILAHPLALQLTPTALDALGAIAAGEPWVRPADARRVIRLALAAIDLAEIRLGLEARP